MSATQTRKLTPAMRHAIATATGSDKRPVSACAHGATLSALARAGMVDRDTSHNVARLTTEGLNERARLRAHAQDRLIARGWSIVTVEMGDGRMVGMWEHSTNRGERMSLMSALRREGLTF